MRIVAAVAALTAVVAAGAAQAGLTDPYAILERSVAASGGLDNIRSHETSYAEGTIEIVGSGLAGPFRQWQRRPELQRLEVELGPLAITQGNNGEVAWTVDQNGKVQIHRDELTVGQEKADSLMAEFAHLDRGSAVFAVTYDGLDTAAGAACYVVTITNTLSLDTTRLYIDTASFRQRKSAALTASGQTITVYDDFRTVAGVEMPFSQRQVTLPVNMVQNIVMTKYEANVPIEPAMFNPPSEDVSDVRFADGDRAEDIPFRFIENHIYVPVTVKGKERLWILDSGAEMTVVEKRFAEEIGLETQGNITGKGAGNLVDVTFTTVPMLSIDDRVLVDEQKVAVIDLYWFFQEALGLEIAGILGYDFLSRVVTRVDYAGERLSFYEPGNFAYAGPGGVLDLPISQRKSFEPEVIVDGVLRGNWYLDLGAGGLSFGYPYARANGLLDRPGVDHLAYGAGGSFPVRAVRFDSLAFAGFTVRDEIIDIPAAEVTGAFAEGTVAGNLGNSLFRRFVLFLDYSREQLIVEKGVDFDRAFPRDNSGMQVRYNRDQRISVSFVAPGTPAATSGLQVGDLLRSANGIDISNLDGVVAVRRLFQAGPGTAYDLVVERDGRPIQVRLTLRDLYQ